MKKRCYYEVLEVPRNADAETLKRQYRMLAMQRHPDKNGNTEAATQAFQELQNAYSVLKDPNERSWYDTHRESFLRGDNASSSSAASEDGIDLVSVRHSGAFKGFGSDAAGFWRVYSGVLSRIDELEELAEASSVYHVKPPSFGDAQSPWSAVAAFYAFWTGFSSKRPMAAAEKWDIRDAPNRDTRRAMEVENKKARDAARKSYSEEVRSLAMWLKRRDPRVKEHEMAVAAAAAEAEKKRKEDAAAKSAAAAAAAAHRTSARAAMLKEALHSDEQQQLERMLMQQWRELPQEMTGRRKGAKKVEDGGIAITVDASDKAEVAAGGESAETELFCEACRKWFKSEQQMQQHIASKKHKEKQLEWEELLAASCADSGGKSVEDDDEVPDAVPTLDDSDEEFEAQLRSMHLGVQQSRDNSDAGASRIDGLHVDSVCAAAAVGSESDDEEETTPSAGKKKKKKKVKRNVMVAASLLEEEAAEVAASFPPCNASDEEEGDGEAVSGKKLTKKQIRRAQEKQKLAEAAAEASAAALLKPDVISGATARSAPADAAPAVCQVCGAQFLSKTKLFAHIKELGHAALKDVAVARAKGKK